MTDRSPTGPIEAGLHSDDVESRLEALETLLEEGPPEGTSADALAEDVLALLEAEPVVREAATHALVRIGPLERAHLERLETRLDHDDPAVRRRVVDVLDGLSRTAPEWVAPAAESIVSALVDWEEAAERSTWIEGDEIVATGSNPADSGITDRRMRAVGILERTVRADPVTVLPAVEELLAVAVATDHVRIRATVLGILTAVADSRPSRCRDAIGPASAIVADAAEASVRANAAFLLAMLAEAAPTAVADAVEGSLDVAFAMLESSAPRELNAAIGLLAYVAEERPEAVEPATEAIVELLDHDLESVRGNVVWALSFVEPEAGRERIERLAQTDPDERVRELAADTLESLPGE